MCCDFKEYFKCNVCNISINYCWDQIINNWLKNFKLIEFIGYIFKIDMINDLSEFFSINHKNKTNNEYRTELFNIFLSDKRKLYSGIILIILSLIIYFVDGVSI